MTNTIKIQAGFNSVECDADSLESVLLNKYSNEHVSLHVKQQSGINKTFFVSVINGSILDSYTDKILNVNSLII